MERKISIL